MIRRRVQVRTRRQHILSVRFNHNFSFSQGAEIPGPILGSRLEIYEYLLKTCCKQSRQVHSRLIADGFPGIFNQALKSCKIVYARTLKHGLGLTDHLGKAVLDLYGKCERLHLSETVFDRLEKKDVSVAVLNSLVKSGRLGEAFNLFSQLSDPNAESWNLMISGHAKRGHEEKAVKFFVEMRRAGVSSTESTLGSVLSAVASLKALRIGLAVHGQAIKQWLDCDVYAGSSLINMYAKCNELDSARSVFDYSCERNVVVWNAMLSGYVHNGFPREVVKLFMSMEESGVSADEYTYTSILSACGCLETRDAGHQLHGLIIKRNYESNLFVGNTLLDMYAKCGSLPEARNVFEHMKYHDNVSWNAIIGGLVKEDMEHEAIDMLCRMMAKGTMPDGRALTSIIEACANIRDINNGKQMHSLAIKCGVGTDLYVGSSLIDLYVKCQATGSASKIFYLMPRRNVVSINALLAGCAEHNLVEALNLFQAMHEEELEPSEVTFRNILDHCNQPSDFGLGQQIHSLLLKKGYLHDTILVVSLVGLYMKYRYVMDAHKLFFAFPDCKCPVLYTSMISGLNQNECYEEALAFFSRMHCQYVMLDQATFVSVLRSCSASAAVRNGTKIHSLVLQTGFVSDTLVCTALTDMYAKCGDTRSSLLVFQELEHKSDVIPWNSIIVGFAKNGYAKEALKIFDDMIRSSVKPDEVTFLGILIACSHVGKISEGRQFFEIMTKHYGIQPRMDHCACMVDLLGRGGLLAEAERFINELDFEPGAVIWSSFLGACKSHGDDVRGQYAAAKLIELEPENSSAYSLLSSIYASSGNWVEVDSLRKVMREKGVKKSPAYSWIGSIQSSTPISASG